MPRILKSPNSGSNLVNVIPPEQGGHGKKTATEALTAMGLASRAVIGAPGGMIALDLDANFDDSYLKDLHATIESVTGDLTITVGQTKEYFLTSYDSFVRYDIRPISGSLTVDRNVISYTAGLQAGPGGFTVNGRTVAVTVLDEVTSRGIAAPRITSPVRGDTGKVTPLVVTSSAYASDNGQTHQSSTWQISEYPDFSLLTASVSQSASDLTSWTLGALTLGKHYFVRVRHHGSGGSSGPWSTPSHFTMAIPVPAEKPSIVSPVNGSIKMPSRVLLTGSAYSSAMNDPHVASSWQISEDLQFNTLTAEVNNSPTDKLSSLFVGLLPNKTYYARTRYRGELHGYTEWSTPVLFRTRAVFLPTTEIGVLGTSKFVSTDITADGLTWLAGSGEAGALGSVSIYKRVSLVPSLEDRIVAVAGKKQLDMVFPAGGRMSVNVTGRFASTRSYTQAEKIMIPAGARTITLTGMGASLAEDFESMVGTGATEIPPAVTSVTVTARGGTGTTVNTPGQPYVEAKPEVKLSATGSFSVMIAGVTKTGTYHVTFDAISQIDGKSMLAIAEFRTTGIEGSYAMELLTNSLGDQPASYSARQELARIVSTSTAGVSTVNFAVSVKAGSAPVSEQPYIPPSSTVTIGEPTVISIGGQTLTFAGGEGGAATSRSETVVVTGGRDVQYSVPSSGNARFSYPGSQVATQNLSGGGQYVLPAGTKVIRIAGSGAPGTTTSYPEQQAVAEIPGTGSGSGTFTDGTVTFTSVIDPLTRSVRSSAITWPSFTRPGAGGTTDQYVVQDQTGTVSIVNSTGGMEGTSVATYKRTGGPETLQFTVNLTGSVSGYGTAGVPYRAAYSESTTGAEATFTIQGLTYTFEGGVGIPAGNRSQLINLDGTDLSLDYMVPLGAQAVLEFNLTSVYSCTFTGSGNHTVPSDTSEVTLVGRGEDGIPAVGQRLEYTEKSSGLSYFVQGPTGDISGVFPVKISINNPPEYVTVNPTSQESVGGQASAMYSRTFIETVNGDERKVVEYKYTFDTGPGQTSYVVHFIAYKQNVLLPMPAKWVNPSIAKVLPSFNGKVGTIRWLHPTTGAQYHAVTGSIYFENFYMDPDELPIRESGQPTSAALRCSYRVVNNGVVVDRGSAIFTYNNAINFSGTFVASNIVGTRIRSSLINQSSYDPNTNTTVSRGTGISGNWFSDTYDGLTVSFYPNIYYSFKEATPDLRTPSTRGADTVITLNGLQYTFQGGNGVPAVARTQKVSVPAGNVKPMSYSVAGAGIASVSYVTISDAQREVQVLIDGQQYSFPVALGQQSADTVITVDLTQSHLFGKDVAINASGNVAAVCLAPQTPVDIGYVLVFQKRDGIWTIVDEIRRTDGFVGDAQSVSMDSTGDYILVGANSQPSGVEKIGSFAIYKRFGDKYVTEQLILAPNTGVAYEAGTSVALAPDAKSFVVGAPAGGSGSSALIYERDNTGLFRLTATLFKATDSHVSDSFGHSVAINATGTTVAVSSPTSRGLDTSAANAGMVSVHRKVNGIWTLHCEVRHNAQAAGQMFGADIHLSDDGTTLTVSSPGANNGLGEILFFDVDTSTPMYRSVVRGSGTSLNMRLGGSIAMPGTSGDLVAGSEQGVYVFD